MSKKLLFEFQVAAPKFKNQVISLNNVGKWHRFNSSSIKNLYKDNIKVWNIPEPEDKLESVYIEFHLFRHNKRTLDSDNLGFIIKWTIDAIKEKEWLIDDDKVTYIVFPAILDRELIDTEIKVKVYNEY
jgi:Holliday junction resolvase RusA-like endonuclease